MTQLYDLVLAPAGVKASQFVILQAIAEYGEIAQCTLARQYAVSVETLSRRLSSLRQAGWVQFRFGARKRERVYSLTPEGERMMQQATPYWVRAQERLAGVMGPDMQLVEVIRLLDVLTVAAAHAQTVRRTNLAGTGPSPTRLYAH